MSGRDGQFGSAGRNPFEQSAPPTQAFPPAGARACGSTDAFDVYAATDVTSCPFSESVADAVGSPRGGATGYLVDAYSSVTGRSYSMNCTEKTNGETRCTGGNNAVVVLIER